MKRKLRLLLCLLVGNVLFADLDDQLDCLAHEMQQVSIETKEGRHTALFQVSEPKDSDWTWITTLDILYWHPKVGGTQYAATKNGATGTYPEIGSVRMHDFKWSWGLRAGVGLHLPQDEWDLYVPFTYYENVNPESTKKTPPGSIFALEGFFGGNFGSAKSTFKILYLNLDFELGRSLFISRYLSFRPHVGVKTMRMRQSEKTEYTFNTLELSGTVEGEYYRVRARDDSTAIGPRLGIQGNWFLGSGFHLFSEVAGSLLYEKDEIREKEKSSSNASIHNIDIRLNGDQKHFTPFVQMFSGLSYSHYYCKEKVQLLLKLGYEAQYFFRQNQRLSAYNFTFGTNTPPSTRLEYDRLAEDVMFYGVTFSVRLDF